jgi:hypothetical protein
LGHLYTDGIDGSKGIFSRELNQLCPHQYYFDVWRESAYLPDGYIPIAKFDDWDVIVFGERPYLPPSIEAKAELVISDETGIYYAFHRRE